MLEQVCTHGWSDHTFIIVLGVFTHAYDIINNFVLIYKHTWSMRMSESLI